MLNLLQHLCGIATQTRHYVDAVRGTNATILDTRKTMAGIRLLQKYAVRIGGGRNHRFCLDDGVLIKDNHIAVSGSITQAVALARAGITHFQKIEVECDTIAQVSEALGAGADIIMLDNMNMEEIKQAVKLVDGKVPLEVSGGVSLEKVKALASTGVEFISVGKLTHSVVASDIGLDIVLGL
jgi:nicotinate-nucleotide pyrophosphorylase (carboxylating)